MSKLSEFEKDILLEPFVLSTQGQHDEAISEINKVLEKDITDTAKTDALWIRGTSLYHLERFDEAESDLLDALKLDPMLSNEMICLTAWNDLASISEMRGEYNSAIDYLQESLTHLRKYESPDNTPAIASAYYAMGEFYMRNSENIPSAGEKALENLKKVLDIAPEYPEPLALIGALYLYGAIEQDLKKGKQYFTKFLQKVSSSDRSIDPDNQDNLIEIAKMRLNELEGIEIDEEDFSEDISSTKEKENKKILGINPMLFIVLAVVVACLLCYVIGSTQM